MKYNIHYNIFPSTVHQWVVYTQNTKMKTDSSMLLTAVKIHLAAGTNNYHIKIYETLLLSMLYNIRYTCDVCIM